MNIECGTAALEELTSAFRFNDAVIRNMVISMKQAVTETSPLAKRPEEKRERDTRDTGREESAGKEPVAGEGGEAPEAASEKTPADTEATSEKSPAATEAASEKTPAATEAAPGETPANPE